MLFMSEILLTVTLLAAASIFATYVIFEEDALFDITDFNVVHVVCLVAALASISFDNAMKAAWGAWVESDRGIFFYALFKTLSLIIYFGVIWLVFFKHVMAPMLIDDIDDGYAFLSFADALSALGILCIVLLVTLNAIGHATACASFRSLPLWCLTSFVGLVIAGMILVNFFYEAPSSAVYTRSRFAMGVSSYTRSRFGVVAGFDWHSAKSIPVAILFVEFASQLWLLLSALVVVAMSLFAMFSSLFIGDVADDSNEVRIASGWLRVTLNTGQILAALIASLLFVNFVHDLALMAMGGLSPE
jgi:hypothetical protein